MHRQTITTTGTIEFNASKGKYVGFVNGKEVVVSKNFGRCRYVLKSQYGCNSISGNENGAVEEVTSAPKAPTEQFSINERFSFLEHFVTMVAKRKATSLVVSGPGGLGKTFTVTNTLEKLGLHEDTIGELGGDFIMIKGFTTAKSLYRTLWEHNDKVIVFDDCDTAVKDPIAANILKGALDSQERRIISWNAEFSEREDLPNRFEFTGRCIFISNMPMNKIPQAIQSRAFRVSLDMNTEEKVERIETVLAEVDAERDDKKALMAFIRKHADKASDLNIRSALAVLKIRQAFGDDFERMALYNFTA